MTDTELLLTCIKDCGSSVTSLAKQLNLSRQGLWKKINNKSEFKQTEIQKVTNILSLDAEKERLIFFTLDVG